MLDQTGRTVRFEFHARHLPKASLIVNSGYADFYIHPNTIKFRTSFTHRQNIKLDKGIDCNNTN